MLRRSQLFTRSLDGHSKKAGSLSRSFGDQGSVYLFSRVSIGGKAESTFQKIRLNLTPVTSAEDPHNVVRCQSVGRVISYEEVAEVKYNDCR